MRCKGYVLYNFLQEVEEQLLKVDQPDTSLFVLVNGSYGILAPARFVSLSLVFLQQLIMLSFQRDTTYSYSYYSQHRSVTVQYVEPFATAITPMSYIMHTRYCTSTGRPIFIGVLCKWKLPSKGASTVCYLAIRKCPKRLDAEIQGYKSKSGHLGAKSSGYGIILWGFVEWATSGRSVGSANAVGQATCTWADIASLISITWIGVSIIGR